MYTYMVDGSGADGAMLADGYSETGNWEGLICIHPVHTLEIFDTYL